MARCVRETPRAAHSVDLSTRPDEHLFNVAASLLARDQSRGGAPMRRHGNLIPTKKDFEK